MRTCSKCKRPIGQNEESVQQDRTGAIFCSDCGDSMYDVTMLPASGCSCSRGGNAKNCECRDLDDAIAAAREEVRECGSLVAWANDPTNAEKLLADAKARLADLIKQRGGK